MEKRVIKFRAWNGIQKRMVYNMGIFADGQPMYPMGYMTDTLTVAHIRKALGKELDEDKTHLMQFIGLKDSNGKDIYEGDIVKGIIKFPQLLTWDNDENSNFKMGGEVYYDHSGYRLRAIQNLCDPERHGMVNYFNFIGESGECFREMEVIGDIYSTPELLEDKNGAK